MDKASKQLIYDLIIIGAGPAGLTASIYAARYSLSNIVIGKVLGGELSLAHKICNYPGFEDISGLELAEKFKKQVENLDSKVLIKEVGKIQEIKDNGAKFKISINKGEDYFSKALIVATGSERRRLNIPGEKEYLGKGISYCHSCDGPLFKDKTLVVVGGSDSAVSGAVHLTQYAKNIYIIYRGEQLRAEPIWIKEWQQIEKTGKGKTIYGTNITKILGYKDIRKLSDKQKKILNIPVSQYPSIKADKVGGVELDTSYKGSKYLAVDGVFVEIGSVPGTALVQDLGAKIDNTGHVIVNEEMATNVKGLFCAGDMVNKSAQFKQATWAIGQGAMAAASVFKYLKQEAAPQIRGV